MKRTSLVVLAFVPVALAACSGGDDSERCVPNGQERMGNAYRVCSADGEWGEWRTRNEVFDLACLPPGTYALERFGLQGNSIVCPSLPVEIFAVSQNGTLTAEEPPSNCTDSAPITDGCQRTFTRECSGDDVRSTSIFAIDFAEGEGLASITVRGSDGTSLSCSYALLLTRYQSDAPLASLRAN